MKEGEKDEIWVAYITKKGHRKFRR